VAAAASVWVANELDGSIAAIDPATNTVGRTVPVGGAAGSLAAEGVALWLAVGASATEHFGGTLTVSSEDEMPDSLDPAVNYDVDGWQILSVTNDTLLTFKKVGGPDGATLVPDLATALPQVSEDGLSYRFPFREGIRYSTGDPVRPEDVRHGLERAIALNADAADLFGAIEGAKACHQEPSTCDLSGLDRRRRGRDDPPRTSGWRSALQARDAVGLPGPGRDTGRGPRSRPPAGDGTVHDRRDQLQRHRAGAQPGLPGVVGSRPARWIRRRDLVAVQRRKSELIRSAGAGELDLMTDAPQPEDWRRPGGPPRSGQAMAERASRGTSGSTSASHRSTTRVRQALNYAIDRTRWSSCSRPDDPAPDAISAELPGL
jgi:YVTN family beta-propeller protein